MSLLLYKLCVSNTIKPQDDECLKKLCGILEKMNKQQLQQISLNYLLGCDFGSKDHSALRTSALPTPTEVSGFDKGYH